ncbi:hypothetical protein ES703_33789 [subsurface metagenome]
MLRQNVSYFAGFRKGGKERHIPIGAEVQRILWRYTNCYRPQPLSLGFDYLFLTSGHLRGGHGLRTAIIKQNAQLLTYEAQYNGTKQMENVRAYVGVHPR